MTDTAISVTEPTLPPLDEFIPYLNTIWDNKILTNGGVFHVQLEEALSKYLQVPHVVLFNNGTSALMCAIKALEITGEVITTPYSFIATSHALLWNNLKPVFVDIDPSTFNIDPKQIEAAITPKTRAILAVHCYGRPCELMLIKDIADKHHLNVIYDAAHAFGVKNDTGSILNYGDLSVLSFHATKVFNTFEGGAVICHDVEMKEKLNALKNFGFTDEVTVLASGLNGKMNEVSAAMGLLQLKYIEKAIEQRKMVDSYYRKHLIDTRDICVPFNSADYISNYSYFPILVDSTSTKTRDVLYEQLKRAGIFARRYFYPLISDFPMYQYLETYSVRKLKYARNASNQVICLPIFSEMKIKEQDRVLDLLLEK